MQRRTSQRTIDEPTARKGWTTFALAALVFAFSWPVQSLVSGVSLDPSWKIALHLAARSDLEFGRDLVFTYGPLGFLGSPILISAVPAVLAFAYTALVRFGICLTLVYLARRSIPLLAAGGVAYAALTAVRLETAEVMVVLLFLWSVVVLAGDMPRRWAPFVVPVWALVSTMQLLVKFNTGVACFALTVVVTWATSARRRSDFIRLVSITFVSFLALWVVAEGGVGSIRSYLTGSLQIVSGYSAAMSVPGSGTDYVVIAFLLISVVAFIRFHAQTPEGKRRLPLALLVGAMIYLEFRRGFVRHGGTHLSPLLLTLLTLPLAFVWKARARMRGVLLLCMTVLITWQIVPLTGPMILSTGPARVSRLLDQLGSLTVPSRREAFVAGTRWGAQSKLAVDDRLLRLLEGHEVHVDPFQTSAVWAYRLRWAPVPVFQTYSAYTTELDERNARALTGPRGPERILRHGPLRAIGGRQPLFESPSYTLAMICNFAEVDASARWQVLARVPNRCGASIPAGAHRLPSGAALTVPARMPGEAIYARVSLGSSPFDAALETLFKPLHDPQIELNGAPYRLIPATASGPLLLCLPQSVGFSRPFGDHHYCIRALRILHRGPIRVTFYRVKIDPPARSVVELPSSRSAGAVEPPRLS